MKQNIKIDFHGGTHGNFLEYIVNTQIFKTPESETSIFTPNRGSSHEADDTYQQHREVTCGHFSDNAQGKEDDPKYVGFQYGNDDKIIRIVIDQQTDKQFFIALTNLLHRTSGATFDQHMNQIPESVRNDRKLLRNNLYSKINERQRYCNLFPMFNRVWLPTFDFNFDAFFSYTSFCKELYKLSKWLDKEFVPSNRLYALWSEFIEKNQGYASYIKCDKVMQDILSNTDSKIDCTVLEEAWLNYLLSKFGVYSNVLDQLEYPTNAQEIYKQL